MRRRIIIAIIGGLLIGIAGLGIGIMFDYDPFFMLIMLPIALWVGIMGVVWIYHAAVDEV